MSIPPIGPSLLPLPHDTHQGRLGKRIKEQSREQLGEEICGLRRHVLALRSDRANLLHRSEEHTSELQSRQYLVCRPFLFKKKKEHYNTNTCDWSSPLSRCGTACWSE